MKTDSTSLHGMWSSKIAFILATTGSAVGLGNIWRFPYITAENGGGAFVLMYLVCVMSVGLPLMLAEIIIGRRGRRSPINTLRLLADEMGAHRAWALIGWSGLLVGFMVLSFYSVIAGWTLSYAFEYFVTLFSGASTLGDPGSVFSDLTSDPWRLTFWHTLFLALTAGVVALGVEQGLERGVKILMPLLFALLLVLVGYGMTTGHFGEAVEFLFKPDWRRVADGRVWLNAMGQAFFSLSLGMAAIMAYGAYLPRTIPAGSTAFTVGLADTGVALVAGLAIFPIAFTYSLDTGAGGVGFTFTTLPHAFDAMAFGHLYAVAFFLLLSVAAWTSGISLLEPPVAYLVERAGLSRPKAVLLLAAGVWVLGLGTVLSFNVWAHIKLWNLNIQELLEYASSNLLLPLGGMATAIFAGWILSRADSREELSDLPPWAYGLWRVMVRWVAPGVVFLVLLGVTGVL